MSGAAATERNRARTAGLPALHIEGVALAKAARSALGNKFACVTQINRDSGPRLRLSITSRRYKARARRVIKHANVARVAKEIKVVSGRLGEPKMRKIARTIEQAAPPGAVVHRPQNYFEDAEIGPGGCTTIWIQIPAADINPDFAAQWAWATGRAAAYGDDRVTAFPTAPPASLQIQRTNHMYLAPDGIVVDPLQPPGYYQQLDWAKSQQAVFGDDRVAVHGGVLATPM